MKILLIGGVEFSLHCLQQVLQAGGKVVGVITLELDRAGLHSDFCDLGPFCADQDIPCHRVKNINNAESMDLIRHIAPDIIFIFGWSQLVKKPLLELPPLGCIGTHPALLPRNRGRHPLIWALVEGLSESGLTFFYLDEGADSGDILWQKPFPILLDDNAGTLYVKIKQLATEAIHEFIPQLQQRRAPRIPQDHSLASYWRKRGESDGEVDWTQPSLTIYNLIRALTHPYCAAHTFVASQRLLLWKSALPDRCLLPEEMKQQPGTILGRDHDYLDVRTGDGYLRILELTGSVDNAMTVGTVLGRKS